MNPHESRKLCLEKPLQCPLNVLVIKYSIKFLLLFTFSYICLPLVFVGGLEIFFSILATIYCQTYSSVINMSQNSLYFLFLLVLYLHVGPYELLLLSRFWSCFVISLSPGE